LRRLEVLTLNKFGTITNDEPYELYGTYINRKFTKTNKIIVKDRKQQEKTLEELERELGL